MDYNFSQASKSRHLQRLNKVCLVLKTAGVRSVLDLGCGPGEMLVHLWRDAQFRFIVGVDASPQAISIAKAVLTQEGWSRRSTRLELVAADFLSEPLPSRQIDAVTLIEVIEHLTEENLSRLEQIVFQSIRPQLVVVTTPDAAFTEYLGGKADRRHPDHQFEWNWKEADKWSRDVARKYGYGFEIVPVGDKRYDVSYTHMLIFRR